MNGNCFWDNVLGISNQNFEVLVRSIKAPPKSIILHSDVIVWLSISGKRIHQRICGIPCWCIPENVLSSKRCSEFLVYKLALVCTVLHWTHYQILLFLTWTYSMWNEVCIASKLTMLTFKYMYSLHAWKHVVVAIIGASNYC